MNFLHGRLVGNGSGLAVRLGDGRVMLNLPSGRSVGAGREGASVILGLRPEHAGRAAASAPADGVARVTATIDLVQPTGSRTYATFRLAGERVTAELQAHDVGNPGEEIAIDINLRRASLFDPESGRTLQ
jgi:multiple sugar transport system ATP-binding protein